MTDGRTVWITGAGKGIGRALALKYAAAGYQVAASARTADDLNQLAAAAARLDGAVHPFPLDITKGPRVTATLTAIESNLGRIYQTILNAGTHKPTPVARFTADAVHDLFDVNVQGTVNCLSALLATRETRRGTRLAVVASLVGYRGLPSASAYGATKAALINMCESLKPELEQMDIVLQLVNPGFVKTPLTDKNDFPMPFLVSAETAADRIFDGLQTNRFEIAFPSRFALIMKTLRALPSGLFFSLTRKMLR